MIGGSITPISRMEAASRRYCWAVRDSGRTAPTGMIWPISTIMPLGSNTIWTTAGMPRPLLADMVDEVLGKSGEFPCSQKRCKAGVAQKLLQRTRHEEHPRAASGLGAGLR